MKFQVPQFIDVEDKVIGPFSFKQFVYLAGGIGMSFVFLRILPRFLAILVIIPVMILSIGLAFYKYNNQPFVQLIESFFKFYVGPRLYIWKRKERTQKTERSTIAEKYLRLEVPKLGESKLKDLTWQIDARKENGQA